MKPITPSCIAFFVLVQAAWGGGVKQGATTPMQSQPANDEAPVEQDGDGEAEADHYGDDDRGAGD